MALIKQSITEAFGSEPIIYPNIGGSGPKVTLRLVAEYADAWNTFGPGKPSCV